MPNLTTRDQYERCRDAKCTHTRVMERERATYMKLLKSKCRTKKNIKKIQAYIKCAVNHYDGSSLKMMDEKQTKCMKKKCDHLIRIGGGGGRRWRIRKRKSTR